MNCLFITAGGRKVRVLELVGCSDQCPQPPNPPSPGKGGSLTNIQVLGFIFVIFTQKCIANDICDGVRSQEGLIFSLSPPAGPQTKGLVKSA